MMAQIGEFIEIGAYKLKRKIGDVVEITQGTSGIVNVGKVLEVIADEYGITISLKVEVLA